MDQVIQSALTEDDKARIFGALNQLRGQYDTHELLMALLAQSAVLGGLLVSANTKTPDDLENLFFSAWQEACESGGAGGVEIVGAPSKPLVSH